MRVLGVDDWAWGKHQHYGTLLMDLEKRRVIDLLPVRSADSFCEWLRGHPEIRIITRISYNLANFHDVFTITTRQACTEIAQNPDLDANVTRMAGTVDSEWIIAGIRWPLSLHLNMRLTVLCI